jgi:hypothetical protein
MINVSLFQAEALRHRTVPSLSGIVYSWDNKSENIWMVQERLTPHPYRIYEIRTVLVVQKVFLSLELTFAAHWDP